MRARRLLLPLLLSACGSFSQKPTSQSTDSPLRLIPYHERGVSCAVKPQEVQVNSSGRISTYRFKSEDSFTSAHLLSCASDIATMVYAPESRTLYVLPSVGALLFFDAQGERPKIIRIPLPPVTCLKFDGSSLVAYDDQTRYAVRELFSDGRLTPPDWKNHSTLTGGGHSRQFALVPY